MTGRKTASVRDLHLGGQSQSIGVRGPLRILVASAEDVSAIKKIADDHRTDCGFIPKAAFLEAVDKGWLLVAKVHGVVAGFVRFRHRRDKTTTVYEIALANHFKRQGIGTELVFALTEHARQRNQLEIFLKCPANLPANHFYSSLGFQLVRVDSGKRRDLNVWRFGL
ncbi:MAG: GNAT family N-acetyltransferase [Clostridia bacterium]|nr:GNAT family N-acetyltransferase [Clostridia bacterium]